MVGGNASDLRLCNEMISSANNVERLMTFRYTIFAISMGENRGNIAMKI